MGAATFMEWERQRARKLALEAEKAEKEAKSEKDKEKKAKKTKEAKAKREESKAAKAESKKFLPKNDKPEEAEEVTAKTTGFQVDVDNDGKPDFVFRKI